MEALRKAEEAKRQAAQKEKDELGSAKPAPAGAAESFSMEDPVAVEAQMALASEAAPASEPLPREESELTFDLPLAATVQEEAPSIDVPFDFHIDESFGTLDLKPAPAPAPEPEIDYLKPEDLRQFKPAEEPVVATSLAAPVSGLSLTLEEPPEREEAPRPTYIPDPEAPPLIAEPEPEVLLEEIPASVAPVAPVVAVQPPLRASRVDDAQQPEPVAAEKPERPRFKVPGIKATEENRKRESARAVFNAKTGKEPKSRNTRRLIGVAAVLALIPLAGGGYLFLQELGMLGGGTQYNIPPAAYDAVREFPVVEEQPFVQDTQVQLADVLQDPVIIAPEPEVVAPASVLEDTPIVVDATPATDPVAVIAETISEPAPDATTASAPVPEAAAVTEAPVVAEEAIATDALPVEPEAIAASVPVPVSATPPPAPINITRSNAAPQVNAQLTQAYSAFRDQDYYAARALYQQALRELPNNRDALLGLAATSIQLGDVTGARANYSKLLELDPRDALARVGLMDSMPLGDAVQTESQLQGLKAEHPEVAQLSFALGNFYASQRRWNEAQAAYYDALLAAKAESGSAVSPDFAFNLAVSLERLNQPQPAFNFYREALEQSRLVNPGFDVRVLRERLDALERVLP